MLHTNRLKTKLANLPKNSKQWWRINRELMNNVMPKDPIPLLKSNGKWLEQSKDKANCFANIFSEKCKLPERVGAPDVKEAAVTMDDFMPVRKRDVRGSKF